MRAMALHKCVRRNDEASPRLAPKRGHERFDFGIAMNGRRDQRHLERASRCLESGQDIQPATGSRIGIENGCDPPDTGRNLHLPAIAASWLIKPVIFPPGRDRLATKPSPTGSETDANTIGITRVSRWNAAVGGVPCARITSGCRSSNSFADIRMRSTLPPPQRTSMRKLLLLIQPNFASSCVNS